MLAYNRHVLDDADVPDVLIRRMAYQSFWRTLRKRNMSQSNMEELARQIQQCEERNIQVSPYVAELEHALAALHGYDCSVIERRILDLLGDAQPFIKWEFVTRTMKKKLFNVRVNKRTLTMRTLSRYLGVSRQQVTVAMLRMRHNILKGGDYVATE